jgi:uncharacterized membrane protein YheB (UPF0754 family)
MDLNTLIEHLVHNWTHIIAEPWLIWWLLIFPPVLFGIHGWLATEMAIWALFRPYEPLWGMPWAQGIFPKRRAKLATAVASTITETLLTTKDIRHQTELLVTEANIYKAIDAFTESVLKEFRDTTKLHRLAADLAELSPAVLQHLVVSVIDGLEQGKEQRVALVTEKIFDQVIMSARIPLDQANEIAARLMDAFLTPSRIRAGLVKLLSSQNISALDESISAHASGPYKLLARIIGVKRVCYEWRNYLEKEPDESERIISDLSKRFGIRDQIAIQIANFDLRSMPLQNIAQLRENLVSFVQTFMLSHKADILAVVQRVEGEAMGTVRHAIIRFNPESISPRWLSKTKQDVAAFFYAYLQRELGELLEKAIPALGMYTLISQKIDMFSPQQLETLIKRICKHELRWLAILGGIIGVWLGLIQCVVNIFLGMGVR